MNVIHSFIRVNQRLHVHDNVTIIDHTETLFGQFTSQLVYM